MNKKFVLIIPIIILISPLVIYFIIFRGIITSNHSYWSEFGGLWGGVIGPVLSGGSILYLIFDKKQREDKELLFKFVDLLQKESVLISGSSKSDKFHKYNLDFSKAADANIELYLYKYYETIVPMEWPNKAIWYFMKNAQRGGDFSNIENCGFEPTYSYDDKVYIGKEWLQIRGKREYLKAILGRPLRNRDEALTVFYLFANDTDPTITSYLFMSTFNNLPDLWGNTFYGYINLIKFSIENILEMKDSSKKLDFFLSRITPNEGVVILIHIFNEHYGLDLLKILLKSKFLERVIIGAKELDKVFGFYGKEKFYNYLLMLSKNDIL